MKRLYLQNSIKIKFGKHAARIFALLVQEKQLEDDQISDLALIPKEETRVLLYKMMNSGLVRLREIPIKPQEPSSNKIFYLWSVPTKLVFEAYKIEILYRNWIDLFERREKSVKKENGDSLNENSENLKEEETGFEEKLERLQKQIFLFEN
ncbi:DNA-directed RNA polymerase III subunit RPC3 [Bonamia ostreae]|uniref:DNA-directed RNA polymerase III subunit RPC3 n=1 Tax=Bonamia ostreae TaxID=126728 RepID=A0ABV2APT4_9EUKA